MAAGFSIEQLVAAGCASQVADELVAAIEATKSDEEVLRLVVKEVAQHGGGTTMPKRAAKAGGSGAVVSALLAAAEVTVIGKVSTAATDTRAAPKTRLRRASLARVRPTRLPFAAVGWVCAASVPRMQPLGASDDSHLGDGDRRGAHGRARHAHTPKTRLRRASLARVRPTRLPFAAVGWVRSPRSTDAPA